jgi:hypothetical protein
MEVFESRVIHFNTEERRNVLLVLWTPRIHSEHVSPSAQGYRQRVLGMQAKSTTHWAIKVDTERA